MKITVITAVRNRAAELESTIRSVLAFSRPGLDFIVVDGASTDGTIDVLRAYDARLKHWLSEPDAGAYDAMNKGWALADPDSRVLYLGAGDRLLCLPESATNQEDRPDVLYGNVQLAHDQVFHACADWRLRLYNSLHHQALLIPKGLHPRPPFDLGFPLYADFDFNQRLARQGARFRFEPHLSSYAAPGGLTAQLQLPELTKIIWKNYGLAWSGLAILGFALARALPPFQALRPIRTAGDQNRGRRHNY
jgi:glycosyltransferase involved in cell wall biosynthesis